MRMPPTSLAPTSMLDRCHQYKTNQQQRRRSIFSPLPYKKSILFLPTLNNTSIVSWGSLGDSGCNKDEVESWLCQLVGGRVSLDKDDRSGMAVVTLDHLEKRNAITGKMMVDLSRIVTELECWEIGRGVMIVGAGDSFCSGFDLQYLEDTLVPGRTRQMSAYMHDLATRMLRLPLVSAACIKGHAFGGGAELAMACDFRVADKKAKIRFVHGKLGTTTGYAGATRLVRVAGRTNALKILCSSLLLSADDAYEFGVVAKVIDSENDFIDECKSWLIKMCGNGPVTTMRAFKQIIHYADQNEVAQSLAYEQDVFTQHYGSKQHIESVSEFKKSAS